MSELRNSIVYYKNDKFVLNDGILEFEGLENNIKLGTKKRKKTRKEIKM